MINNNKSFANALQEGFQKVLLMLDNCYTKKMKKATCKSDPEDIWGVVRAEEGTVLVGWKLMKTDKLKEIAPFSVPLEPVTKSPITKQ